VMTILQDERRAMVRARASIGFPSLSPDVTFMYTYVWGLCTISEERKGGGGWGAKVGDDY